MPNEQFWQALETMKYLRKIPASKIGARRWLETFNKFFKNPQDMNDLANVDSPDRIRLWNIRHRAQEQLYNGLPTVAEIIMEIAEDRPVTIAEVLAESDRYAVNTIRQTLSTLSMSGQLVRQGRGLYRLRRDGDEVRSPYTPMRQVIMDTLAEGARFSAKDLVDENRSYSAVRSAICALHADGFLERVGPGVYRRI